MAHLVCSEAVKVIPRETVPGRLMPNYLTMPKEVVGDTVSRLTLYVFPGMPVPPDISVKDNIDPSQKSGLITKLAEHLAQFPIAGATVEENGPRVEITFSSTKDSAQLQQAVVGALGGVDFTPFQGRSRSSAGQPALRRL